MKNLDVLIVRLLPIILYFQIGYVVYNCWDGISTYPFNLFHSNSFPFSISLFIISLSNKKYHCIWNRALYIELSIIPLVNYIGAKYDIFNTEIRLYIVTYTLLIAGLITIILAVYHFIKTQRSKSKKNCYGEYKPR